MREQSGAWFCDDEIVTIDDALLQRLKTKASESETRRFRLCLHASPEDTVQEMVVVHCRDNYSRPHAHAVALTYIVLEGTLRVLLFDDHGCVSRSLDLGARSGPQPFATRIAPNQWYMPVCLTPQVVFYECKQGPFERSQSNRWAPWSPEESDTAAIDAYRRRLGIPTD